MRVRVEGGNGSGKEEKGKKTGRAKGENCVHNAVINNNNYNRTIDRKEKK
jgi:hypothetical protein